jgi:hypothetical protein
MNAPLVWQGESATAGAPAKCRIVGTRASIIGRWRYRQPILEGVLTRSKLGRSQSGSNPRLALQTSSVLLV